MDLRPRVERLAQTPGHFRGERKRGGVATRCEAEKEGVANCRSLQGRVHWRLEEPPGLAWPDLPTLNLRLPSQAAPGRVQCARSSLTASVVFVRLVHSYQDDDEWLNTGRPIGDRDLSRRGDRGRAAEHRCHCDRHRHVAEEVSAGVMADCRGARMPYCCAWKN